MFAKQSAKVHALFPKGQGRAVCIERESPTGRVIIVIVAEREEREDKREREKRREERKGEEKEAHTERRERARKTEKAENASVCAFKTPPCVRSGRLRVFPENARMFNTLFFWN